MDVKNTLNEIGLSNGEAKVYLALLKLGSTIVSKLKEETELHRTTIYDFLEKLLNKGLVSYVITNNVKYYSAADPDKLVEFIKEKEEKIKEVMPRLKELSDFKKTETKVEVYKGKEGYKTFLNDVIKTKKDIIAFGIDESLFKEKFPIILEQYFKKEAEAGIKERLLTSEKVRYIYKKKTVTYRYIPEKYFGPTPTMVYGNKVMNLIWEPLTIILIENKGLAESYRKHFEMLWEMAKVKP